MTIAVPFALRRTAIVSLVLAAALHGPAMAVSAPPTLDCSLGVAGARAAAVAVPGAVTGIDASSDIVRAEEPDAWIVEYAFTAPGHPAHPAATLRTQIKQVTGVWTSQSKGCGYGDQAQFTALMSQMKARDSELTNASRAEVERNRPPPLGGAP